jgi:hypothetical protein
MRATKLSQTIFLCSFFLSSTSFARDEDWGIFQFRQRLDGGHQIFAEYVRRESVDPFSRKFLDLYRLSWGGRFGEWGYLVGGAYIDFDGSADERRLHQFGIYNFTSENQISGLVRIGLEERSFISDEHLYLRFRNRLQLNLFPQFAFGPSAYDEIFYVPEGHDKFSNGFNENRLGLGFRYFVGDFEIYVFHTTGYLKTLKSSDRFEWFQLQTVFSF